MIKAKIIELGGFSQYLYWIAIKIGGKDMSQKSIEFLKAKELTDIL
jgi:hypothetical protein